MKYIKCIGSFFFGLLVFSIAFYIYCRHVEPNLLTINKYEISKTQGMPKCKIVFFSDTHFGELYSQDHIKKLVKKINKEKPDLILFGGDFFDNYARDVGILDLDLLARQLLEMQAVYGKYAIYGNHDYGGGASRVYEDFMKKGGFEVLRNENVVIEELGINLIGFDDLLMGEPDVSLAFVQGEGYPLFLAHEPDIAEDLDCSNAAVMVAGHSHGGQVLLPFVTKEILPYGAIQYYKGNYPSVGKEDNIQLLVSSGIGMASYPFRFLNVPEIVAINVEGKN